MPSQPSSPRQRIGSAPWLVVALGCLYMAFGLFVAWRAPWLLSDSWSRLDPLMPTQHGGIRACQFFRSCYMALVPVLALVPCAFAMGGSLSGRRWLGIAVAMTLFGLPAASAGHGISQFVEQGGTGIWSMVGLGLRHAISPLAALAILLVASVHVFVFYLSPGAKTHFGRARDTPTGAA